MAATGRGGRVTCWPAARTSRSSSVDDEAKVRGDARSALSAFVAVGGKVSLCPRRRALPIESARQPLGIVVDAVLGTGTKSRPRGNVLSAIDAINDLRTARGLRSILPVELGRDLSCLRQEVYVRAAHTVTFGFLKTGARRRRASRPVVA